jgi:N-acetylneuraminic acid mutarotase
MRASWASQPEPAEHAINVVMTVRSRRRRVLSLAIVAVLGIVLGVGGYLTFQVLSAPAPRPAPGWALLADMPKPRGETAAAVTSDRLYIVGGLAGVAAQASGDVSVYDATTNQWAVAPALPEPRHHAAAVADNGAIYVTGGAGSVVDWTPTDTLWVLRPRADAWVELAPMPDARLGHRMVVLGRTLYVVGGIGDANAGVAPTMTLVYDPVPDAWSLRAPLELNRDHLAVVVVDGRIWALGGRAGGSNHALVDIYDPASDAWEDGPALPEPVSGAAEGAVNGMILISGGEDPGPGVIVDRHWLLDTSAGAAAAWVELPAPPLTVHGAPGVILGGQFVIAGGSSRPGGQSSTAWTGATQVLVGNP